MVSIFWLYIIMMVLTSILKEKRWISFSIFFFVNIYIALQLCVLKFSQPWYNTIISFPIGVLCAYHKENLMQIKKNKAGWLLVVVFITSFILTQLCGTSHYWPTQNDYIYSPILMNITCLSFALLIVILTSVINIKCGLFNYIGVNSYTFFIGHLVLVTFAGKIHNVYAYIIFVLAGTFVLAWLYSVIQHISKRLRVKGAANN